MTLIRTADQLKLMVEDYLEQPEFVFDVETVPSDILTRERKSRNLAEHIADRGNPRLNRVAWVSFASQGRCDVLPLWHWGTDGMVPQEEAWAILRPLFFNPEQTIVGHNVKFDLSSILKYYDGEVPTGTYGDTIIAGFLIDQKRKNKEAGLGQQVKRDFGYEYDKSVGKTVEDWKFRDVYSYSYRDSKYTWLLWKRFKPLLDKHGFTTPVLEGYPSLWDLEMNVLRVLVYMEKRGADIAVGELDSLDVELAQNLEDIRARVYEAAGYEFNLNAAAAKGKFVYEVRGHKPREFTKKTGKPSTAAASLEIYAKKDPIVGDLLAYSDVTKLHGTYVKGLKPMLVNNRLHADFIQYGAETGRFSCRKPNLQNIPRPDTAYGKRIRSMFAAPYQHSLVVADYSQVELRVLTHYSQDPTMIKAFKAGLDIHQATADELGTDRTVGKAINFAIPFGAGPQKVSEMAKCSERQARAFLDAHAKKFPRIPEFKRSAVSECRRTRPNHVATLMGRKRFLPEINSPDFEDRGHAERQAVNTKIQGSAADIIKLAMWRLHTALEPYDDCHLILSVHDELVTVCPDEKIDLVVALTKEAMEGINVMKNVRLEANVAVVKTWDQAK